MDPVREETIAAISTPPAEGGIAIIRISGPDAIAISDRIYQGKNGKTLALQASNTIHYGMIFDFAAKSELSEEAENFTWTEESAGLKISIGGDNSAESETSIRGRNSEGSEDSIREDNSEGSEASVGTDDSEGLDESEKSDRIFDYEDAMEPEGVVHPRRIDEALVSVFRAPHSYTGEDTVEINCHGGLYPARKILEAAVRAGARPAEPGEFTKRAFLNGRLDLSQAESVMDLIRSKNDFALHSSLSQLKGSVSREIGQIRSALLHETAYIEAALDDPEHIVMEEHADQLTRTVMRNKAKIQRLIEQASNGQLLKEGIKTVIIGKPNAGKSSLLNGLLGEEKAIVTDIAGTTRDVLENQIVLSGITLNLLDTAGIRDADNEIEKIGIDRAVAHAKEADLLLYVVDGSVPMDENDEQILSLIQDKKTIVLLNKNDLDLVVTEDMLQTYTDAPIVPISAKKQEGIAELEQLIIELFFGGDLKLNDEAIITNARHIKALEDADRSLTFVLKSIDDGMPEDFYSIDLMDACDALGKITGQTAGEDLINEIFSSFCMGK